MPSTPLTRWEHRPVPANSNPAVWILIRVVMWLLQHSTEEAYTITMIRWDPICANQHDTGLDQSGTGSSETMHDGEIETEYEDRMRWRIFTWAQKLSSVNKTVNRKWHWHRFMESLSDRKRKSEVGRICGEGVDFKPFWHPLYFLK